MRIRVTLCTTFIVIILSMSLVLGASGVQARELDLSQTADTVAAASVSQVAVQSAAQSEIVDLTTYKLTQHTIISNNGTQTTRDISLHVPILAVSSSGYQVITREQFNPSPTRIETDQRGNRKAVFEFLSLAAGQHITITESYWLKYGGYVLEDSNGNTLTDGVTSLTRDPAAVTSGPDASEAELATYLVSEKKIESDDPSIISRARKVTEGLSDPVDKAKAIFDFVINYITYDSTSPTRNQGALAVLTSGRGVCEEYASLFVAMARAVDIPARIVNGFAQDDKRGNRLLPDQNGTLDLRGVRHQWAEFYVDGSGWIPVDPTFSGKPGGNYYRFASLPSANHIIQNYGDAPITGRYTGGRISVSTDQVLAKP